MNLKIKIMLLYFCIALVVIVFIGEVLPLSLEDQNIDIISDKSIETLKHIDFALSNFVEHSRYDVYGLSLNKNVQAYDDSRFTSYLNASDVTFAYAPDETEKAIVGVLKDFQTSHPFVQSVYMGRENGAFIRSQPWDNYTSYDPRTRPWYTLAKENPGEVVITDPYRPITSSDVKIGISKALVDENGNVYGVVGTDLTLIDLTGYISGIETNYEDGIVLTDHNGIILASGNSSLLFSNIETLLNDQAHTFLNNDEGVIVLEDTYFTYYTSPEIGWKIGEFIPFNILNRQINESILQILVFVVLALALLSIITMLIINHTVIRPISDLTKVSRRIAETGDLDQDINTDISDEEIATLAHSFKAMVERIRTEELEREEIETQVAVSIKQIEENMCDMAILNDEIRNPLTVIMACAEMSEDEEMKDKIIKCVYDIDMKINTLDKGWLQSEKVWNFLNRHYGLLNGCKTRGTGKDPETGPDEESK